MNAMAIGSPILSSLLAMAVFAQPALRDTDSKGYRCVAGIASAPIKIEVFSDFQCPGCRDLYVGTMRSVLDEYAAAGKVCVVYHELPLKMHQHALEAARYGQAAQRLGQQFWRRLADALYSTQDQWAEDGKIEGALANALSVDELARLRKEMMKSGINAAIESDLNLAKKLVIEQTPTLLVTTKTKSERTAGVVEYAVMKRFLDYYLTH
jgi:protein-disulfide isomerase